MTKYQIIDGEREEMDQEEVESISSSRSLTKAKKDRINQIKENAQHILSETDWYVVRKQETDESIPQSVIDHRAEVRSLSDQFESDVNALESVSEVRDYAFEYPKPPER